MQMLLFILPLLVHMPKRCIKRRRPGTNNSSRLKV
nr:MAG TPA: hypothetical protein [Caudoviricetes sp.]